MVIVNTYVDYDFISRKLHVRYKLGIKSVYDYYKKRKFLSTEEKLKLRQLFCKSIDEVNELTDKDSRVDDLLRYVLETPIVLKSAYSEVGKAVYKYVRNYPKVEGSIYKMVEDESKVKEAIGNQFNGILYEELRSEEHDEKLKYHTMESPYSHCVEYIMKCDFIFFKGEGLTVVQEYEIPPYSVMVEVNGLCPNKYMPSDHFPVAAKFHYSLN